VVSTFAGYALYWLGLSRRLVRPNRASWLIWSAAITVEAATYAAVNPHTLPAILFVGSAGACGAVTLAIWRRAGWAAPSKSEAFCMAACLAAIALWLAFRAAFWAHMLVVAAVPVSFWPTWASARADPAHERSPAWGLWTIGDLAVLLVAARAGDGGIGTYAYIFVELVCHAGVWLMIGLATINPLRSLARKDDRIYVREGYRGTRNRFAIGENQLGKAVYAAQVFGEGDLITRFRGRRFPADKVPNPMHGAADRFVQVTADAYLGPSGGIDDLINHSCQPNAGLRFTTAGVFLIAIRPIAPGDEITWDYSTTLSDVNWHMICRCQSVGCRRVIGNFETLSPERQQWYRARNLVPPYLRHANEFAQEAPEETRLRA
jgi:hypothetical protein